MKRIFIFILLSAFLVPASVYAQGWNIDLLQTMYESWNTADVITCQGDYAYLGLSYNNLNNTGGIAVVDISDPGRLMQVGYFKTIDDIKDIVIVGDYAYAGYWGAGLIVLDISDPAQPVQISISHAIDEIVRICIVGNFAYIGGHDDFAIIDISNPYNPVTLGQMTLTEDVVSMAAFGSKVYVGSDDNRVNIIDVSDPANPVVLNYLYTQGSPSDMAIEDNYLYLAQYTNLYNGGLYIYDISDPVNPQYMGSNTAYTTHDIIVSGDIAYTLNNSCQLINYDVSNPTNPTFISQCLPSQFITDFELAGDMIFGAYDDFGLKPIDVSDPFHPIEYPNYEPQWYIRDVDLAGNYAFITNQLGGLMVLDVSDPGNMVQVSYLNTIVAYNIDIVGNYAYIRSAQFIYEIVDLTDPLNPFVAAEADLSGYIYCTDEENHRLYLRGEDENLLIYDITDPTNPVLLSDYWLQLTGYMMAWFDDISVEGDILYGVAQYWEPGDGGPLGDSLVVLDITDPTIPNLLTMARIENGASQIEVWDNLVYLGSGIPTISILDASNPVHPILIGSCAAGFSIEKMILKGNYIYSVAKSVSYWDTYIHIINVTDPSNPEATGYYLTPDHAYYLAVGDEKLFVADNVHFESYDCDDAVWVKPGVNTETPDQFDLLSAYPNPFNASTVISYKLLAVSRVDLAVYDVIGREVAKLVDDYQNAGNHEVIFNAKDLVSGVYFVRLEAGEYRQTRKILLIK